MTAKENPSPESADRSLPGAYPSERAGILIVDDHQENLVAFEALLSPLGHEIVVAHSGSEALERAFRRTFAIILLDVRMPEMNGFETAAILRKRESYRDTPIIFTSAYTVAVSDLLGGYVAGATDFVETPVDAELLKFKVAGFVKLHLKTERVRKSAHEVATAFDSLKIDVGKGIPSTSLLDRMSRLEQSLAKLETDLSSRTSR